MKEKNRIVIFITVIVVLFIALFLFGRPGKNENKEKTNANSNQTSTVLALKASETFYDFGTISMKDGNVSKTFKISNSSDQDINLERVTTSCMCTVAYIIGQDGNKKGPFGMPGHGGAASKANELIKAGESRDIEVVYDPNAHGPAGVGMIDRFVYLEDSNGARFQFEIKANVTP